MTSEAVNKSVGFKCVKASRPQKASDYKSTMYSKVKALLLLSSDLGADVNVCPVVYEVMHRSIVGF